MIYHIAITVVSNGYVVNARHSAMPESVAVFASRTDLDDFLRLNLTDPASINQGIGPALSSELERQRAEFKMRQAVENQTFAAHPAYGSETAQVPAIPPLDQRSGGQPDNF